MPFCIVCGRFDRELQLRKSGLKCKECVGKKHTKEYALLQHQQAAYILARSVKPSGSGPASPRPSNVASMTSAMFGAPPHVHQSQERKAPFLSLESIVVTVEDPRTEEIVSGSFGGIQLTDTATTYNFVVRDLLTRDEIVETRHRFKEVYRLFSNLKEIGPQLPDLPSKKMFSRFDPHFVEDRRQDIERFVAAIVADAFLVRHPQFLSFLNLETILHEQQDQQGNLAATHAQSNAHTCENTGELAEEELRAWKKGSLIGKGAFGAVYMGLLPSSSQLVAVKVVQGANASESSVEALQSELELLRNLSHPNIVRFLGALWDSKEKELTIFTEYIECGSVANMVKRFGALPLPVIQRYLYQILEGLVYLHSLDVVHRDIKGDNILVTKEGLAKLADFGCSGHLEQLRGHDDRVAGTPMWMAPEVIRNEAVSAAADIWSVGCVGLEMLQRKIWNTGETDNVFTQMFRIQKATGAPDGMPAEGETAEEFRDFLAQCFERDPAARPSAKDLLSHSFFSRDFDKMDDIANDLQVAEEIAKARGVEL